MTEPSALIVVQNAPVERDVRVRRQAEALAAAGVAVSVVCPRPPAGQPLSLPGVVVRRFPRPPEGPGAIGFAIEYAWSLACIAVLVAVTVWRDRPGVVQLCNPPDFLGLAVLPFRRGRVIVFDHHDPAPEMYETRFGRRDALHRLLVLFERSTLRWADHVIATNRSLARRAVTRGRRTPSTVTVVRNAPVVGVADAADVPPASRGTGPRLLWVGHMGDDDGVIATVEALSIVHQHGHEDAELVLVGDGELAGPVAARALELGVDHATLMLGWCDQEEVLRQLAAADVGLVPDQPSPRSQLSTMIKVMEYMTFGVPIVATDLAETRVSAGPAAVYVRAGAGELASGIVAVLDDPPLAARLGQHGRERMSGDLAWSVQSQRYVELIRELLASGRHG